MSFSGLVEQREVGVIRDELRVEPAPAVSPTSLDADFAVFFSTRWAPTYRLAGLMGADDAEDVAQEAMARLHRRFARFVAQDDAEKYLRATVCNLARSRWRRRQVADRAAPRLVADPHTDPTAGTADSDAVAAALTTLSGRQRQVIVLRYWLQLNEAEIAETLGVSPGSVKVHASRGIRALKEALSDDH